MLTEAILNEESQSFLESASERHGSVFRKARIKGVLGGLVVSIVASGFLGLLSADKDHAFGGAVIGFLIGVPIIFYQLYRLIIGLPRAETTPEATVKRYLSYCVLPGSQMVADVPAGVEGYTYLLNIAQKEMGDIESFQKYWQEMNYSIRKELRDQVEYYDDKLLATDIIEDITVQHSGERVAHCIVTLKVEVGWTNGKLATEGLKMGRLGLVFYQIECELGKVGDRWYLASGKWNGVVTNVLKGANQKFRYIL